MNNKEKLLYSACQKYKQDKPNLTEREKAKREVDIWNIMVDIHGRGIQKKFKRRKWFKDQFGGTSSEYEDRFIIHNLGSTAELIWDNLNKNFTLASAVETIRIAKRNNTDIVKALEERANKLAPKFKAIKNSTEKVKSSKEFSRQIKLIAENFAEQQLKGTDPYFAKKIIDAFMEWVDSGVKDLFAEAQKLRKDTKQENLSRIGRTRFNQACEVFGIIAKFGDILDRKDIRSRAHKRAGPLHPDKTGGNEAKTREYHAVIEARQVLEDYMDQIEEGTI